MPTTHGMKHTRTYRLWNGMKYRCNHNKPGYESVSYNPRWERFEAFYEDMGECPEGLTLDRYPKRRGNYGPDNCRWATHKQQANNRGAPKAWRPMTPMLGIRQHGLKWRYSFFFNGEYKRFTYDTLEEAQYQRDIMEYEKAFLRRLI